MTTTVRLLARSLHYPPGFVLHTASSGRVASLDELYLVVEREGRLAGFGEIRENVAYLTGIEPAEVRSGIAALAQALDWSQSPRGVAAQFESLECAGSAIARALIDSALVDWVGRERGVPAAELFDAAFSSKHDTNQTLFLCDDAELLDVAERYVSRGFRKLKLRVGALPFAADCNRLALLRRRFGDTIELAVDANGMWGLDEAADHLRALAPFDLAYAEQPIAAGDWRALADLAGISPVPVMLDESVASAADVDRVIKTGGKLWAHLKIIKLGGITPTIGAARRLEAAGIPFMIGQMNEGASATAAAFHCTVATRPTFAELYGADGLTDDPVRGVSYGDGSIRVERAPGLGVSIDTSLLETLWEIRA